MYNNKEFRFDLIKGMNAIMISMNNEEAYCSWIYIVPDCATDDDFEYIAEDEDLFEDAVKTFMRLYKKYAKDGLYINEKLYI